MENNKVDLSLTTICGGMLEEEFQKIYPDLVTALGSKDSASLNITITLKRVPDTNSMINTTYKLRPAFPPIARSSVCQISKGGKLETDIRRQLSLADKLAERAEEEA